MPRSADGRRSGPASHSAGVELEVTFHDDTRPASPPRTGTGTMPASRRAMSLTENRAAALTIEPMRPDDWPAVHRIYAEGIATGDATLEREAPDWNHFDRSHPRDC